MDELISVALATSAITGAVGAVTTWFIAAQAAKRRARNLAKLRTDLERFAIDTASFRAALDLSETLDESDRAEYLTRLSRRLEELQREARTVRHDTGV